MVISCKYICPNYDDEDCDIAIEHNRKYIVRLYQDKCFIDVEQGCAYLIESAVEIGKDNYLWG